MVDRVLPLKLEDTSSGGDEIDTFPTSLDPFEDHIECAGLVLDETSTRDESVRVYRSGGNLTFVDASNPTPHTLSDLLAGGMGEDAHRLLDQLTHAIDEDSFDEVLRTNGKIDSIITWETDAKLKKIREVTVSRSAGKVASVVLKQYDASGVLKEQLTETYTRVNGRISSVNRVRA